MNGGAGSEQNSELASLVQHTDSEIYYFPEHSSCRKILLTDNNSQYDQYHHCYNDSHLKEKYEHLFIFFFLIHV